MSKANLVASTDKKVISNKEILRAGSSDLNNSVCSNDNQILNS